MISFLFLLYFDGTTEYCYRGYSSAPECPSETVEINDEEEIYSKFEINLISLHLFNNENTTFHLNISKIGSYGISILSPTSNYVKIFDYENNPNSTLWFENSFITIETRDISVPLTMSEFYLDNCYVICDPNLNIDITNHFLFDIQNILSFDQIEAGVCGINAHDYDFSEYFNKEILVMQPTSIIFHHYIDGFNTPTEIFCDYSSILIKFTDYNSSLLFTFTQRSFFQINIDEPNAVSALHILGRHSPIVNVDINVMENSTLNLVESLPNLPGISILSITLYGSSLNFVGIDVEVPIRVIVQESELSYLSIDNSLSIEYILVKAAHLILSVPENESIQLYVGELTVIDGGLVKSANQNIELDVFQFSCENDLRVFDGTVKANVEDNVVINNICIADGLILQEKTKVYSTVSFNRTSTLYVRNTYKTKWPITAKADGILYLNPDEEMIEHYKNHTFWTFCSDTLDCDNYTASVEDYPEDFFHFYQRCGKEKEESEFTCLGLFYTRSPRIYHPHVCYVMDGGDSTLCDKDEIVFTEGNISELYKEIDFVTESLFIRVIGEPQTPISFEKFQGKVNLHISSPNANTTSCININSFPESNTKIYQLILNRVNVSFLPVNEYNNIFNPYKNSFIHAHLNPKQGVESVETAFYHELAKEKEKLSRKMLPSVRKFYHKYINNSEKLNITKPLLYFANISLYNHSCISESVYDTYNLNETLLYVDLTTINYVQMDKWENINLHIFNYSLNIEIQEEFSIFNEVPIDNRNMQYFNVIMLNTYFLTIDANVNYSLFSHLNLYLKSNDLSIYILDGFNQHRTSKIFHLYADNHPLSISSQSEYFPFMLHNASLIGFTSTPEEMHISEQEVNEPTTFEVYSMDQNGTIIFDSISANADFSITLSDHSAKHRLTILSIFAADNVQIKLDNVALKGFFFIESTTTMIANDVDFTNSILQIKIDYPYTTGSIQQMTKYSGATFPSSVVLVPTICDTSNSTLVYSETVKAETTNDAEKWIDAMSFQNELVRAVNGSVYKGRIVQNKSKIFVYFDEQNDSSNNKMPSITFWLIIGGCSLFLVFVSIVLFIVIRKYRKKKDLSPFLSANEPLVSII